MSCPDNERWGNKYVFSPFPPTRRDASVGLDVIGFGSCLDIVIFFKPDKTLWGLFLLCLGVPQMGTFGQEAVKEQAPPLGLWGINFGTSIRVVRRQFWRLLVPVRETFLVFLCDVLLTFLWCFLVSWNCFELVFDLSYFYGSTRVLWIREAHTLIYENGLCQNEWQYGGSSGYRLL